MRACAFFVVAAALVLPASVASAEDEAPRPFLGTSPMGDFSGPVRSMQALKYRGVVRQQFDFSCGSAALATLLRFYGETPDEATTFRGMWKGGDHAQIRTLGFSLLDMKRYLAARGKPANGYQVTLADIEKAGVPGIALVTVKNYRHFVVVQGVRGDEVLIADPALGLRVETAAAFQKSWNGIFFAIDSDVSVARARFNAADRWSTVARAPLGARFADPLSIQALSLTAPFYRDF
jgi:hypothetical protein